VAAVVAVGLSAFKARRIGSFHTLIEDAHVPRDIFVFITAAVVTIASWINRDESLFFTYLVVVCIKRWPRVSLAMEIDQ